MTIDTTTRAWLELRRDVLFLRIAAERLKSEIAEENLKAGYRPTQPRVPAGSSTGGQWTGGGGNGGRPARPRGGGARVMLPPKKPQRLVKPAMTAEELARFNRNAPEGLPPEMLEVDPNFGVPRWYVEGAAGRVGNPLTDALAAVAIARGAGIVGEAGGPLVDAAIHSINAGRLAFLRKLPRGVTEVGKSEEILTSAQSKSLKSFRKKNSRFKNNIEVINRSDGNAVIRVIRPAENIPKSYAVIEKVVTPTGDTVKAYKVVYAPDGKIVSVKNK